MSLTGKPDLTTLVTVTNDGFWPDLSLGDLMSKYRIPPEYDDNVIKTGVMLAIVRVNSLLTPVKLAVLAMPYQTFVEYVAARQPYAVDGAAVLQLYYENAVSARAKAVLLKQFNSLNRKPGADNNEGEDGEQYWLDESQTSIKALFNAVLPLDVSVSGKAGVYAGML
jgi:hypothetical protein